MNFTKIILLNILLVYGLYADEIRYICPSSGFISAIKDGKKIDFNTNETYATDIYVVKTEWYGKPIYISKIEEPNNKIYKNTQSKVEWIQSDSMIFKAETDDIKMFLSLEKGSTPILIITFLVNNSKFNYKKAVTTQECYKE